MIRRFLVACSLVLLYALALSNLTHAENHASKTSGPEGREEWRVVLLAANHEVYVAQERDTAALRAYESMRHRRHPRGEGKKLIVDEVAAANEQLATAELKLAKVEKAARRDGAPPSWFRFDPAEIAAPPQVPASPEP